MSMATFEDVLAFLDTLGDEFRFMSARRSPPDAAMIDRAAGGAMWPEEYRRFVEKLGCMYVDVKDEVWPRPRAFEVRPQWQMCWGLWVHGVHVHPDLDVTAQTRRVRDLGADVVPILRIASLGREGIGYADGELVRWRVGEANEPVDGTLADHVLAALRQLAEDRERLRAEPITQVAEPEFRLRSTVTLEMAITPAAIAKALEVALAGLPQARFEREELAGFTRDLDDALLSVEVDGRRFDVCGAAPLAAHLHTKVFLQSITDPRGDDTARHVLATFEAALATAGRVVNRSTNF
jgi:hypothetical protein